MNRISAALILGLSLVAAPAFAKDKPAPPVVAPAALSAVVDADITTNLQIFWRSICRTASGC